MIKLKRLWEILDILSFLILIISLGIILLNYSNCPENIDAGTMYGLFISAACNFGFKGVTWVILAFIAFIAIIFFTNKLMRKK
jgi:hypothetical protein